MSNRDTLNIRVSWDPAYRITTIMTNRGFTQMQPREKWQAEGIAHMFGVELEVREEVTSA